jgi:PAS domain S-box-containing protein
MPEPGSTARPDGDAASAGAAAGWQRHQALLKAEALQNAILTSASFSIIATDERGMIQLFNDGAERMLGYRAAEVVNRISPSDIHDPQEVVAHARALSLELGTPIAPGFEALAFKASRGIEDIYELTYIRKDGSRFPASVSITSLRNEEGGIIGYLLIGTDLTLRHQAEGALRASEERYRAIFESIDEGFCIIEKVGGEGGKPPDFRYVEANPAFATQSGLSSVLGKTIRQVVPDEAEEWCQIYLGVLRTGQPLRFERELISQGRVLELHAFRVNDEPHRRVAVIFKDITERQRGEQTSALLGAIVNSSDDAIISKNLDGTITSWNRSAERLYQYSAQEAIGKPVSMLIPGDRRKEETETDQRLRCGEHIDHFETVRKRKDGTTLDISLTISPVKDARGRLVGLSKVARDITERKQSELALSNAIAVADKASRAKTDFLSAMSHELRTPLNAILGFAQLMETGTPALDLPQMRNLDRILKAGWYLLDLINEILDLALIESGRMSLSMEPVSLAEIMLECRTLVEPQAQMRGIDMTFPRLEIPYFIKADRTRAKQALINLLSNAIKYNKPEGSVAVEYALSPPASIRIGVRDTGPGLAPEQLAQLFQPFNRIGRETGIEEGTGIGLVVTKRLVEQMDGAIGADSVVGVGSVFWIELLLTKSPQPVVVDAGRAAPAPVRAPAPDGTQPRTLLYVEENPTNLELVGQLIARRPDLRLLTASDANLGIEYAHVYQPEVILTDINLPGISGIEVMKILRADPSTAHIPVIALSANAMSRDIEKALEAGFFNYLTKPLRVGEFMDALDAAFKFAQVAATSKAKRAATKEQAR